MFFRDFTGDYRADPFRHLRFATTARSLASEDDLLDVLGGAFLQLHDLAAERAGKARWADKNPDNVLYLPQWRRLLGDEWLFVHVVRNPLDNLGSMKETSFPLTLPEGLADRIAMYVRYNEAALSFASTYPDRYVRVAYEDLVGSPEEGLARLMRRLGEEWERTQLAFGDKDHGRGLEDPKIAATDEIHTRSVGRWKELFTDSDARQVKHGTAAVWSRIQTT